MLLEPEISEDTFKGTFLAFKYLGSLFNGKDSIYRTYNDKMWREVQKVRKKLATVEEAKARLIEIIREFRFLYPEDYSGSAEVKNRLLNLLHEGKLYDENGERFEAYPTLSYHEFFLIRTIPEVGEIIKSFDKAVLKYNWLLDGKQAKDINDFSKFFKAEYQRVSKGTGWRITEVDKVACVKKVNEDYERLALRGKNRR